MYVYFLLFQIYIIWMKTLSKSVGCFVYYYYYYYYYYYSFLVWLIIHTTLLVFVFFSLSLSLYVSLRWLDLIFFLFSMNILKKLFQLNKFSFLILFFFNFIHSISKQYLFEWWSWWMSKWMKYAKTKINCFYFFIQVYYYLFKYNKREREKS